jgi:hypothetical protein
MVARQEPSRGRPGWDGLSNLKNKFEKQWRIFSPSKMTFLGTTFTTQSTTFCHAKYHANTRIFQKNPAKTQVKNPKPAPKFFQTMNFKISGNQRSSMQSP